MVRNTALALALLWGTAGVAYAGLFSDDEAHRKIDELKRQSAQQIQGMDERMAKMESQLTGQGMVDMLNQLETLKTDLNKLRGQLEVQMHELETTQKRQKDLYADLDTRLRNLEVPGSANAAVVASSVAQQPATSAKGVTAQAAPTADPAESGILGA